MGPYSGRCTSGEGDAEGCKVSQISTLLGSSTKNIHHVVYDRRRMAFPRNGDVSDAVEL